MEAPTCQKIPSCGKRHFGECGTTQAPRKARPGSPKKKSAAVAGGKKSKPAHPRPVQKFALSGGNAAGLELVEELLARVESLESRVGELEARKKYMREYQRDRRLKEKKDG